MIQFCHFSAEKWVMVEYENQPHPLMPDRRQKAAGRQAVEKKPDAQQQRRCGLRADHAARVFHRSARTWTQV